MLDYKEYLNNIGFEKYFQKLKRKLKNKSIVIYGAGELFKYINKNYNLSDLNIIGVSDLRFHNDDKNKDFMGYKIILKDEIVDYKPDYVVVATLKYISIVENFTVNLFDKTKIKTIPLAKRKLWDLIKEIWEG